MASNISDDTLASYKAYLELVQTRLIDKYFEEQKPYICCKEGCSYCCEHGQYPMTEVELAFLMLGFRLLPFEMQKQIQENFEKLKNDYISHREKNKENGTKENFMYQCPFLIDKKCSVYDFRALICRTHGLLFFVDDKDGNSKNKVPYCVNLGLNYSNIYDKETKTLSEDKMKELGIDVEPVAYNLSLKTLFKKEITREFDFEFGEAKALIDFFVPPEE